MRPIKVLDVGAGCGYYSEFWLQKGAQVVAIEPVKTLCQAMMKRLGSQPQFEVIESNHRALYNLAPQSFHGVILAGPLYHLFDQNERLELLKRVQILLKPGGWVWGVHLSRAGFLRWVWRFKPEWILSQAQSILDVLERGYDSRIDSLPERVEPQFLGYFDTLPQVLELYEKSGLHAKSIVALDPIVFGDDNELIGMPSRQKQAWMEFLAWLSHWDELVGASRTWAVWASGLQTPSGL